MREYVFGIARDDFLVQADRRWIVFGSKEEVRPNVTYLFPGFRQVLDRSCGDMQGNRKEITIS